MGEMRNIKTFSQDKLFLFLGNCSSTSLQQPPWARIKWLLWCGLMYSSVGMKNPGRCRGLRAIINREVVINQNLTIKSNVRNDNIW